MNIARYSVPRRSRPTCVSTSYARLTLSGLLNSFLQTQVPPNATGLRTFIPHLGLPACAGSSIWKVGFITGRPINGRFIAYSRQVRLGEASAKPADPHPRYKFAPLTIGKSKGR